MICCHIATHCFKLEISSEQIYSGIGMSMNKHLLISGISERPCLQNPEEVYCHISENIDVYRQI